MKLLVYGLAFVFTVHLVVAQKKKEEKDFSQAEYYFAEGMKFFILESYSKAIDLFQRSLEINPESSGTNYTIADALARLGRYDDALKYAEKALKLDESNKYFYVLLAQIYERQKKYNAAVKVYQDLLKKIPLNEEYNFEIAGLFEQQSKYED
ncbi:MAG: tetratricopeptide repeat protein, partial [Verrucomicrobia bacterium]|nr:tetratricopeptide repeat protein [Cytophagales bacterium]